MEIERALNKIVRNMEFLLIGILLMLYILAIGISIFLIRSFLSTYFIVNSFIYYLILIRKSPGLPLDMRNGTVRGICGACNKVRGNRTHHCYICDECYNRPDYHCPLIGRCVTQTNVRDLYFCLIFLGLFSIYSLINGGAKVLLAMPSIFICLVLGWMSMCVALDKTAREMAHTESFSFDRDAVERISKFIFIDPFGTLLPFLKLNEC